MIPNVKKILILVETDDGSGKQTFDYEAWSGYEWTPVTYPFTGFSKDQIADAFNRGIARLSTEIEPVEITFKEKKQ